MSSKRSKQLSSEYKENISELLNIKQFEENIDPPIAKKKGRNARKNNSRNNSKEILNFDLENTLHTKESAYSNRRSTFLISEDMVSAAKETKPKRRGRRNKSEENILQNEAEVNASDKNEVLNLQTSVSDGDINASTKRTRRGRNKSADQQISCDTTEVIMADSSDNSDRRGTFVVTAKKSPHLNSQIIESLGKTLKTRRGRKIKSKKADEELPLNPIEPSAENKDKPDVPISTSENVSAITNKSQKGRRAKNKHIDQKLIETTDPIEPVAVVDAKDSDIVKETHPKITDSSEYKDPSPSPKKAPKKSRRGRNKSNDQKETVVNNDAEDECAVEEVCLAPRKLNDVNAISLSPKKEVRKGRSARYKSSDQQESAEELESSDAVRENVSNKTTGRGRKGRNKSNELKSNSVSPKKEVKKGRSARNKISNQQEPAEGTDNAETSKSELNLKNELYLELSSNSTDNTIFSPKKVYKNTRKGQPKLNDQLKTQEAEISNAPLGLIKSNDKSCRRDTFVIFNTSDQKSEDFGDECKILRAKKSKSLGLNEHSLVENEEKQDVTLPVGQVSNSKRRGTFSVMKPYKQNKESDVAVTLQKNNLTLSEQRKRKWIQSNDNIFMKKEQLSRKETPQKKVKESKNMNPVIASAVTKSVNFLTPQTKNVQTPKRSNVTLTPYPKKLSTPSFRKSSTTSLRKSVSTPLSVKKTPGQFSAKKMPNFAKIHKKCFQNMESVVAYAEKKAARKDLLSPLNKTFSGLNFNKKKAIAQNENSGRKNAKSLIPIRSNGVNRINDQENIRSFVKKNHGVSVETLREKERNIIKGVRANKRFMLQMKMRKLAP